MDKNILNSKVLNKDLLFSRFFLSSKIIFVITFIGILILWIQYWTVFKDLDIPEL
ncbi:hypothetical protein WER86_06325 [Staphylococcus felis]